MRKFSYSRFHAMGMEKKYFLKKFGCQVSICFLFHPSGYSVAAHARKWEGEKNTLFKKFGFIHLVFNRSSEIEFKFENCFLMGF